MSNIPTIRDVGELLVLLRDSLPARAVAYVGGDLAVCDCANGNSARPIAWIDDTGSARELLNKAYDADLAGDASAWAALPLRYGPYCSTWVLSEHPKAPTKPGSDWWSEPTALAAETDSCYGRALRRLERPTDVGAPHSQLQVGSST